MHVDVQFLPFPPSPDLLTRRTVVVMDILRATSVMVHALSQGAAEIIPLANSEEALQRAKTFPTGTTLLGGERGSRKIEGFDLGNSPTEYVFERVSGKRLILTTTNGTKAFHSVSSGREILAGSFLNVEAIAQRCLELGQDLLLFPSGDEGRFSLEDAVCAGMLVEGILKKGRPVDLTDAARAAHILFKEFENHLVEALRLSNHGKDLIALGLGGDLAFCAQTDVTDIVPVFADGVIRAH
jgi:2-phosphosulfolactate phosphatase